MSLTQNKRIEWIDMAKGYGMIAVIISHICLGPLNLWLYTFHMPLFFFLSGYVFSNKVDFGVFVKKKAKSILLPYVSLGIPIIIFTLLADVIKNSFSVDGTIELIKGFIIQKRLWTLWYIACLFFLNLIFYIITKFIKRKSVIAVLVALMAVGGLCYYKAGGEALPWNIDVCLTALPFFFVGYIYKLNSDKVKIIFTEKLKAVILFVVFGAINVVFGALNIITTEKGLEMFYNEYANPVFTYISAFAGTFAVVIFSNFFTLKPIRFIGENSLVYYAWHQTIMIPITKELFKLFGFEHPTDITQPYYWCYKAVQFSVIVIVLTIPTIIIEKTNLRVILGKRKKYKR